MDFREMYEKYAPAVHRFAFFLSGDATLADDITSETFCRVWASTREIRSATLQGYLFTIAKNLYRDWKRRERRQTELDDNLRDRGPGVDNVVEKQTELKRMLDRLKELPELDRTVLLLRAQQNMPYAEIARTVGISEVHAKVKVHRARLKLMESR